MLIKFTTVDVMNEFLTQYFLDLENQKTINYPFATFSDSMAVPIYRFYPIPDNLFLGLHFLLKSLCCTVT